MIFSNKGMFYKMIKTSGAKKSPFNILFGIIVFFVIGAMLFKPVLRYFFPVKYINVIQKYSNEYNLDEHLVMAIIRTESKFNVDAESKKGAKGLMQLKEETAFWCMEKYNILSDGDIMDPEINIRTGCAYMRYLLDKFGKKEIALAAYNAGEGNVTSWLEDQNDKTQLKTIPFEETRKYVELVLNREKIYNYLY